MTNDEIDLRLKLLAEEIPNQARLIGLEDGQIDDTRKIACELELFNMHMFAVWTMLAEIAKRLPEPTK